MFISMQYKYCDDSWRNRTELARKIPVIICILSISTLSVSFFSCSDFTIPTTHLLSTFESTTNKIYCLFQFNTLKRTDLSFSRDLYQEYLKFFKIDSSRKEFWLKSESRKYFTCPAIILIYHYAGILLN